MKGGARAYIIGYAESLMRPRQSSIVPILNEAGGFSSFSTVIIIIIIIITIIIIIFIIIISTNIPFTLQSSLICFAELQRRVVNPESLLHLSDNCYCIWGVAGSLRFLIFPLKLTVICMAVLQFEIVNVKVIISSQRI